MVPLIVITKFLFKQRLESDGKQASLSRAKPVFINIINNRKFESDNWAKAGYDTMDGHRMLLWHGSRSTNFAGTIGFVIFLLFFRSYCAVITGILSQGLRIAPPEAPVNGNDHIFTIYDHILIII